MSTIHFHQTTTSTPAQFIAGLTDFGPGRAKVFSNSADSYLKVHHQGARAADVVIARECKNLKGQVLSGVRGSAGKRTLGKAFTNSVKADEARSAEVS